MRILILLTGIAILSLNIHAAAGQAHSTEATANNAIETHPDSVKLIAEGEYAYYQKTVKADSIPERPDLFEGYPIYGSKKLPAKLWVPAGRQTDFHHLAGSGM